MIDCDCAHGGDPLTPVHACSGLVAHEAPNLASACRESTQFFLSKDVQFHGEKSNINHPKSYEPGVAPPQQSRVKVLQEGACERPTRIQRMFF